MRTGFRALPAGVAALTLAVGALPPQPANSATVTAPFQRFTSCQRLLSFIRDQALPLAGPYGLSGAISGSGGRAGNTKTTKKAATTARQPAAPVARTPETQAASRDLSAAGAGPATTAAPAVVAAPAPAATGEVAFTDGAANSSTTNTQEANVDEGDLVENDGRFVYSVVDGRLRVVDTAPAQGAARQVASVELPRGSHQLLLDGPRLAVVTAFFDVGAETIVTVFDVTSPSAPRSLGRTHLEGQLIAARSVDHRARIVVQSPLGQRLPFFSPTNPDDRSLLSAQDANRRTVRTAPLSEWMPRIFREEPNGTSTRPRQALSCNEVGRPAEGAGLAITWVATLDLNVPAPRDDAFGSAGVVAAGAIVYSSERTMYIATPTAGFFGGPIPLPAPVRPGAVVPSPRRPRAPTMPFHAFDLSRADGAAYVASGTVAGSPLNQFSMSEHQGVLRIATTTTDSGFGTTTESVVYTLRREGRGFREIGRLGGLGRTERIFGVRFLGDQGYVVTFRQTDPLYVIDLSNPSSPRLAGELKIPGYSAYLHPIGSGLLLGIGQDATEQGQRTGTQVSLFDVNNPYEPTRLAQLKIGGTSEAEYDHHAFLYWPATRSVVVPTTQFPFERATGRPAKAFAGAVVATVDRQAITEKGRITHNPSLPDGQGNPFSVQQCTFGGCPFPLPPEFLVPITRSVIVNGQLVTISGRGVKVNALEDISERAWVPFA